MLLYGHVSVLLIKFTFIYCSVSHPSNVNLSYCWRLYRPIMESSDPTGLPGNPLRDGEAPLISSLIKSNLTAFSVRPSNGTLCAQEAKNFVFCFRPDRVSNGSFFPAPCPLFYAKRHTTIPEQESKFRT